MSGYRVTHDLDDDPVLQAGHLLDEPLEFEDGSAVVDEEDDARDLARRHTHIEYAGPVQEDSFDAAAFVDRTPMAAIVEDIEDGEADGHLEDVLASEQDTRDRSGVIEAVEARSEELEE